MIRRLNRALLGIIIRLSVVIGTLLAFDAYADTKVFDHSNTGFELIGAHNATACENCHVQGQFEGTPRQCAGCHGLDGRFNATPKPPNHIPTSQQCDSCHQPIAWEGAVLIDHNEVLGPCVQCHNNSISFGQPIDHISTTTECDVCHTNTLSWQPVNMNHDGVIGTCVSCHNNVVSQGQPPNHITTTLECDACHTSQAQWVSVSIDHNEVIGTCTSCHNGVIAQGQFDGHRDTGMTDTNPGTECDVCHFTDAFTPQKFEF